MLFGVVPALALGWFLAVDRHNLAVDFRSDYWVAGHRLLFGGDPYAWSDAAIHQGLGFVYPPGAAVLFAPSALLPVGASAAVFTLLSLCATMLALRALDVVDWRLYGVVAVWPTTLMCLQSGNVTPYLVLGTALAWRHRDKPAVAGGLVGALIALKLFLWPLGVWLLVTRRWRAVGWAAIAAVGFEAVGIVLLGPESVGRYASLSSRFLAIVGHRSYALPHAVALASAVAGVGAITALQARGREAPAFASAVVVALIGSPLVWNHYFALLLVPALLLRPRLGLIWVAPFALWICASGPHGSGQFAVAWAATGLVTVPLVRDATRARVGLLRISMRASAGGSPPSRQALAQRLD